MFWDNFKWVCEQKNLKPTPVMKSAGISSSNISRWQNGSSPTCDNVLSLANVLECSTDILIRGKEYIKTDDYELSKDEADFILMFRTLPEQNRDFIYDSVKAAYEKEIARIEAEKRLLV